MWPPLTRCTRAGPVKAWAHLGQAEETADLGTVGLAIERHAASLNGRRKPRMGDPPSDSNRAGAGTSTDGRAATPQVPNGVGVARGTLSPGRIDGQETIRARAAFGH